MILHFLVMRMAVAFGKVNAFNLSQDKWPLYVERLEHVFVANGITDAAKKRAVFLLVIGASNYKLLSSQLLKIIDKNSANLPSSLYIQDFYKVTTNDYQETFT